MASWLDGVAAVGISGKMSWPTEPQPTHHKIIQRVKSTLATHPFCQGPSMQIPLLAARNSFPALLARFGHGLDGADTPVREMYDHVSMYEAEKERSDCGAQ